MRRLAIPAACFLVACLPDRDNPHDPVNAPVAELEAYVELPGGVRTNAGSRTSVFVLDASASHDAAGRELRFTFDDGAGTVLATDTSASLVRKSLPIREEDLPPGGVGSVFRQLRVRVATADGSTADATASVFVVNHAPSIGLTEDLFVPERRGLPVVLDACGGGSGACESFDADGDPVVFRWSRVLPGGPSLEGTGAVLSFAAPMEPQTLAYEISADDGLSVSTARVHVYVGALGWACTGSPLRIAAIHPDFEQRSLQGEVSAVAVDPIEGDLWVVQEGMFGLQSADRYGLDFYGASQESLGFGINRFVASFTASGGLACAVSSNFALAGRFHRKTSGQSAEAITCGPTNACDGENPRLVAPGGTGPWCWALTNQSLYRLTGSTLEATASSVFECPVAAAPTRDGRLVVADSDDCASPDSFVTSLFVVTTEGNATLLATLGTTASLAAHADEGVWVLDPDSETLLRVHEPERCGAAGCVEATTIPAVGAKFLVADPLERSLWVVRGSSALAERWTECGEEIYCESGSAVLEGIPVTAALDPGDGSLKLAESGATLRSIPSHLRPRVENSGALEYFVGGLGSEPTRGSVWVGDLHPRRLSYAGKSLGAGDENGGATWLGGNDDGGAWALTIVSTSSLLQRIASDGSLVSDLPVPDLLGAAAARMGDKLCATPRDYGTGPLPAWRADLAAGTIETLSPAMPIPDGIVGIEADGSCWVSYRELFGCPGEPSTIRRIDPSGASSPFSLPGCAHALAVDPRGDATAWITAVTTSNALLHVSATGVIESFPLPAVPNVRIALRDRCSGASPECLEIWFDSGASVYRTRPEIDPYTGQLRVLERYDLSSSPITGLAVTPGLP